PADGLSHLSVQRVVRPGASLGDLSPGEATARRGSRLRSVCVAVSAGRRRAGSALRLRAATARAATAARKPARRDDGLSSQPVRPRTGPTVDADRAALLRPSSKRGLLGRGQRLGACAVCRMAAPAVDRVRGVALSPRGTGALLGRGGRAEPLAGSGSEWRPLLAGVLARPRRLQVP